MESPIYRRDTCRLCGGRDLEVVLQLTPTPVGTDYVSAEDLTKVQEVYPLDLSLCMTCGYAGLRDVVAPGILFDDSREITSMSLGVVEDLQQLADATVTRLELPKNSLVVDIGSNDGTLLRGFQNLDMRVVGVEPATFAADLAVAAGIPTLPTYFTTESARTIKEEWGPAQVISANRVLANVDGMDDLGEGIQLLLAPDGVVVFETGYLVDILENNLFDTIYHEHLGYDTANALDAFFRGHGLQLIDIERIPIKGGSLRGLVQLVGGPLETSSSVTSLMDFEVNLGIDRPEIFKKVPAKLAQVKAELGDLLFDIKGKGKTVAGYGASVGSTTMIYHLGLGNALRFLADDSTRFQNLFSPGYHIPVLSSQSLYDQNPDYVIILAWRHSEAIIKKHQMFLDQGGHFIVPLPEPKVV